VSVRSNIGLVYKYVASLQAQVSLFLIAAEPGIFVRAGISQILWVNWSRLSRTGWDVTTNCNC